MQKSVIIKNREEISITELRKQALDIIEAGVNRVLPSVLMESALKYNSVARTLTISNDTYNISKGRIFVVGGGKAAGLMAEMLEKIIEPENIEEGVVNCKDSDYKTSKIKIIIAGHPIPDQRGIEGVKQMLALRDYYSVNKDDLVICLISGGGSVLMPYPVKGIRLEDKQETTKLLLSCGAEIEEINTVRKHLSEIKGGWLGHFYSPAKVISLIISDVVGNKLDVIASGPTFPDSSTFPDALSVLQKYDLLSKVPENVTDFFKKGSENKLEETPKVLNNCHNYIIGDNRLALEAMETKAKEMGFNPYIITFEQIGDPATMAQLRADEISGKEYKNHDLILIGGETTPKLPDDTGKGGRNQHYIAVSMLAMEKYPGKWIVASLGTDGSDFLPDVAGAIIDNNSLNWAKGKGINIQSYLNNYDSNTLLKKIGKSLIITGNTGTNVGDIIIYILK